MVKVNSQPKQSIMLNGYAKGSESKVTDISFMACSLKKNKKNYCAGEHTLHGLSARRTSHMELVHYFLVDEEPSHYC